MTSWNLGNGESVSDNLLTNIRQFFSTYPIDMSELIAIILTDLSAGNASNFNIAKSGRIVFIYSDVDWMDVGPKIEFLFDRLCLSIPKRENPNEVRSEAFISVLASKFITQGLSGSAAKNMTANDISASDIDLAGPKGRYLYFEIAPQHAL